MTNCKEFGRKRSYCNLKVLSRHSPEGTEEKHEKPQLGWPVFGTRLETGTCRIRSRSVNHSTTTFSLIDVSGVSCIIGGVDDQHQI
jgi:hypothetical protein